MRKHYRRYASIQKRWIRLGEILHPAEYHTRFPKPTEHLRFFATTLKLKHLMEK